MTAFTEVARASALCDIGRYPEAIRTLGPVLATNPHLPRAWCVLALAQVNSGLPAQALQAASTAVSLAPDDEWPHRLASVALGNLGRYDEALVAAREAVRLSPHDWHTHAHLAYAASRVSPAHSEACQAGANAVALAPGFADAHIALGTAAFAAGNSELAQSAFTKALELDPQNATAHQGLAHISLRGKGSVRIASLADATRNLAAAVQLDPTEASTRTTLDLVVRQFLSRLSYLIMVVAWFGGRAVEHVSAVLPRILPAALMLLPAGYAWQFLRRLSPDLRHYVARVVRSRGVFATAILQGFSIASLVLLPALPAEGTAPVVVVAILAALAGRLVLRRHVEQFVAAAQGRPANPMLSRSFLLAMVGVFTVTLTVFVIAAASGAGAAIWVLAVICAGIDAGFIAILVRRQRQAATRRDGAAAG